MLLLLLFIDVAAVDVSAVDVAAVAIDVPIDIAAVAAMPLLFGSDRQQPQRSCVLLCQRNRKFQGKERAEKWQRQQQQQQQQQQQRQQRRRQQHRQQQQQQQQRRQQRQQHRQQYNNINNKNNDMRQQRQQPLLLLLLLLQLLLYTTSGTIRRVAIELQIRKEMKATSLLLPEQQQPQQ